LKTLEDAQRALSGTMRRLESLEDAEKLERGEGDLLS